ncbi:UNVERIFIED_CONTAM: hypothetical protein Sangu_2969400 [Sesamum angustifolium]|uniref:Uncharacterized protein n=1 Tax=Sesamum angustifolium TaxID=2727405 RepID=A0AAW2IK68_9LAMI
MEGTSHTEQQDTIEEFVGFFQQLLGGEKRDSVVDLRLTPLISLEEIKKAFFDIEEDRALGPDGYSAGFYKAAWLIIDDEIAKAVMDFFTIGRLLKQVNATLLALIPKTS